MQVRWFLHPLVLCLYAAVDNLENTAGDIALSFNNQAVYVLIRDAGIRSGESSALGLLSYIPLNIRPLQKCCFRY